MNPTRRELLLGLAAAPAIAAAVPAVQAAAPTVHPGCGFDPNAWPKATVRFFRQRGEERDDQFPSWMGRHGDRFVFNAGVLTPHPVSISGRLVRDPKTVSLLVTLRGINQDNWCISVDTPGFTIDAVHLNFHASRSQELSAFLYS